MKLPILPSALLLLVAIVIAACRLTPAEEDVAPQFGEPAVGDYVYNLGVRISALTLPTATGGNGGLTYSLEPTVPGLSFDPGARTFSGTPTVLGTYPMTYRVMDGDENVAASDADTLTFSITVEPALRFEEDAVAALGDAIFFTFGEEIEALTLPAAVGAIGEVSYRLEPVVPGLTFDATTRTLSGTPTETGTFAMIYQAADAEENTTELTLRGVVLEAGAISSTYRGHGNEVFHLNSDQEALDDTLYTLWLGDATATVYAITTNANEYEVTPKVELTRPAMATTRHRGSLADAGRLRRLAKDPASAWRPWIRELNNSPPLARPALSGRLLQAQPQPVTEGQKDTFLDRDSDNNVISIPATARKVVTDGSKTLSVWVADANWTDSCQAQPCVQQAMVDALAERFLRPGSGNDIHDWMTAVFGAPWGPHDEPYLIPPEHADHFHILLFDIDNDGEEGSTVGFYSSRDNFIHDPSATDFISNERIMFYIDSHWLADDSEGATDFMLGTLAHEFQHTIHWYQKFIVHNAAFSELWLNEMASEVASDLVSDKLMIHGPRGVAYDDPTAGEPEIHGGRLPDYNLNNYIQVSKFDSLASYSISYALGAYLARTYGGAALFGDIVQSSTSGIDAVTSAISSQGHGPVSFGDVLANWGVATLLSDDTGAPDPYSYNSGTWRTSHSGGLTFRLGSINLYNYRIYLDDDRHLDGPFIFTTDEVDGQVSQEPHSNKLVTLGRHTGAVQMRITAELGSRITIVVKEE